MNKKKLYESIMKDVSKIVKKHLNEQNNNIYWENQYKINLVKWISNAVESTQVIDKINDVLSYTPFDAETVGYALADGVMYSGLEAGGLDMIIPDSVTIQWIIKSILLGYDMKVNNTVSNQAVQIMKNDIQGVEDGFMEQMQNEAYYFVGVNSENEITEYIDEAEIPVAICNSNGEWEITN